MAALSAVQGGIKSITHYKVTSPSANSNFGSSQAITAVADTSKTELRLNGVVGDSSGGRSYIQLHLASTISVEYCYLAATDSPQFSFSVIQYY